MMTKLWKWRHGFADKGADLVTAHLRLIVAYSCSSTETLWPEITAMSAVMLPPGSLVLSLVLQKWTRSSLIAQAIHTLPV